MSYGIEHPDHTGSSANPLAPWNQQEAEVHCPECGHRTENCAEGEDCPECGDGQMEVYEYEPDWDSMPGGHDDY